jgi:hypothetical protein
LELGTYPQGRIKLPWRNLALPNRPLRHLTERRTRETVGNRWTPMETRTILPRERLT